MGARDPLAGPVARLGGYRGIAELTGLTLAAEVIDWRRFASARAFMGFTGLTCSEIQRVPDPPRQHHQGLAGGPHRPGGGGLGVPVPAQDRADLQVAEAC